MKEEASSSLSPQNFQPTIAKISVSQICQSVGFKFTQSSALTALSNILTHYLKTLSKTAVLSANSSGRTECNIFDIVYAIEEMGFVQGFKGCSNLKNGLLKSSVLNDIMMFVDSIDEIPFAKPIPRRGKCKRMDFGIRGNQVSRFSHFPTWVPRLPDISTYKDVDVKGCREDMFGAVVEEKNGNENENENENENVTDCLVDENVERKRVNVEKKKKKELLPVKRPKVKFKFGMDSALGVNNVELGLRNGVCRGGKRVSCHNLSEEEDIMSFKRRR